MNVVLLGPQGAGKGTQAQALKTRLGLVQVASGDVLRAAIREATDLGLQAKRYYDAGELVPDAITVGLLLEAIHAVPQEHDVLLDGFPRTVAQARALEEALADAGERIDLVLELRAPLEVVQERLLGRLICRTCGTVYNVRSRPPKTPGICDLDGGELYQRADDYPEAIEKRLRIWEQENGQLVQYYDARGILHPVDANRSPDAVTADLVALVESAREAA